MVTNVYAKSNYDQLRIDEACWRFQKFDNNNNNNKSKNNVRSDWGVEKLECFRRVTSITGVDVMKEFVDTAVIPRTLPPTALTTVRRHNSSCQSLDI